VFVYPRFGFQTEEQNGDGKKNYAIKDEIFQMGHHDFQLYVEEKESKKMVEAQERERNRDRE
jgi:hypothetical protein